MEAKELLVKMNGLSADEQEKMLRMFVSEQKRKSNIEESRRVVREKCFKNCKKMTKTQQISYLYEFLNANNEYIANWLVKKYPELAKDN